MGHQVTVVDYGVGNLYSVQRALEVSGADEITFSADPAAIAAAERLILPGVGAFADGMRGLRERRLVDPITAYARSGRPLLGICLGMQMLASVSEEFGLHEGLGIIPGDVKPIPRRTTEGTLQKVPFIGWTPMAAPAANAWIDTCLEAHPPSAAVYLVHSFHVVPRDPRHLLATYDHGGNPITAAIRSGRVTGLQFHPEKSGPVGLDIMRRFVAQG